MDEHFDLLVYNWLFDAEIREWQRHLVSDQVAALSLSRRPLLVQKYFCNSRVHC